MFGEMQSCAGMAHDLRQLVLSGFNRHWPQVSPSSSNRSNANSCPFRKVHPARDSHREAESSHD
jgi:hypothetical protein